MIIAECFYPIVMLVLKISLSLFFLRIISIQWQRYAIYIALGVTTIGNVMFFSLMLFQCGKPGTGLDLITRRATGQCISTVAGIGLGYTHGLIDTLTDVWFATLPYFLLRHSTMSRREQWSTTFVLMLAAV
jgi:hypothetical protein